MGLGSADWSRVARGTSSAAGPRDFRVDVGGGCCAGGCCRGGGGGGVTDR